MPTHKVMEPMANPKVIPTHEAMQPQEAPSPCPPHQAMPILHIHAHLKALSTPRSPPRPAPAP